MIVVFQMDKIASWFAERLPERLVFIPMYDGVLTLADKNWMTFQNSRILNFSHTLHEKLQRLGIPSLAVQYYPDPAAFARVDFSELHGFLWQRGPEIAWPLIKRLVGATRVKGFTLHLALDPDSGAPHVPSDEELRVFNVASSCWQDDRAAFEQVMAMSNVYFAPRTCEGIGMSFLEAMARGQCVVAPDAPTMSEYITSGVSGLLYDETDPRALDFSKAAAIGAAARRKVERGFLKWQKDQQDLLPDFIFGGRDRAHDLLKRLAHTSDDKTSTSGAKQTTSPQQGERMRRRQEVADRPDVPLVTVAMVTRNARETFHATFDSILSQTYPNVEVLIVDGASNDGTQDLFAERAGEIDRWISEPDRGPFDGMNKAAHLAKGRYIIFMNAGDLFASEHALASAMAGISDTNEPDFIVGHHVYVTGPGIEELHKANDFDETWLAMREGRFSWKWLSGIPCHQATLTRTAMLRDHGYDLAWRISADHDFMYRMRLNGARFHNCDETLAIYFGGGFSAQNEAQCHEEWWRQICIYGDRRNADRLFNKPAKRGAADEIALASNHSAAERWAHGDIIAPCFSLDGFGDIEGPYSELKLPRIRWAFGPSASISVRPAENPDVMRIRLATFLRRQSVRFVADGRVISAGKFPEPYSKRPNFVEFLIDLKKLSNARTIKLEFSKWDKLANRPFAAMLGGLDSV